MFDCCVVADKRVDEELMMGQATPVPGTPINDAPAATEPGANYRRNRRAGVSAEAVSAESIKNWTPKIIPKSKEDREEIIRIIGNTLPVIFGHLTPDARGVIADVLEPMEVSAGTDLIKQGDSGDYFYIVRSGEFDIYVQRGSGAPAKVASRGPGGSFGELALLYNAPRAATVRANQASVVWKLDRDSFRMMLVTDSNTRAKKHEALLSKVEMFQTLNKFEKGQVNDLLHEETFDDGAAIIRQGEVGDKFYILDTGAAVAKLLPPQSAPGAEEIVVKEYAEGDCFGELALLSDLNNPGQNVRKASVYAVAPSKGGQVKVLSLLRDDFDRVLGPIKDLMKERAAAYPTYDQAAKQQQHQQGSK